MRRSRFLASITLLIGITAEAAAAGSEFMRDNSQKACIAWSDIEADKTAKKENLSTKSRDTVAQTYLTLCNWAEREAIKATEIILPIATEPMVVYCARNYDERDSEAVRNLVNCLNNKLQTLPDSQLPKGIAFLYRNGDEVRFWRIQDCLNARRDGEACAIK